MEVVTEPDLRSGAEAAAYGAELRKVVTFLGISNGNMQVFSAAFMSCSHSFKYVSLRGCFKQRTHFDDVIKQAVHKSI